MKLSSFINIVFSLCLVGFMIVWTIWVIRELVQKDVLLWPMVVLSGVSTLLALFTAPLLEQIKPLIVPFTSSGVNFSSIPLGGYFLLTAGALLVAAMLLPSGKRVINSNTPRVVIVLFGPAMFVFFALHWWSGIDRVPDLSVGDDWTRYQLFAFRIAVWGELLSGGGEGLFSYQPLYRYLVAVLHCLFGRSFLSQQLFDVWCVLGAVAILVSWLRRYGVSNQNALLAAVLYLVPVLMGPVRHHIGRGLTEHAGMIFLLLAVWLLTRTHQKCDTKQSLTIVLAGIVSVLAYWARQDHLLILVVLAGLWIEPVTGGISTVWRSYKVRIFEEWRPIFIYLVILTSGVVTILLRRLILADDFLLSLPDYLKLVEYSQDGVFLSTQLQLIQFFEKLHLIITMKVIGELPSPFAIVMILGVGCSFISLFWRPALLQIIPITVGLMITCALLPYYFVHFHAYPPRFSIHVLPIATASFIFVWDHWIKMAGRQCNCSLATKFSELFGGLPTNGHRSRN